MQPSPITSQQYPLAVTTKSASAKQPTSPPPRSHQVVACKPPLCCSQLVGYPTSLTDCNREVTCCLDILTARHLYIVGSQCDPQGHRRNMSWIDQMSQFKRPRQTANISLTTEVYSIGSPYSSSNSSTPLLKIISWTSGGQMATGTVQ